MFAMRKLFPQGTPSLLWALALWLSPEWLAANYL